MSKPYVNMTNWELCVYDNKYHLSGTVDYHPNLGKGIYVSGTSSLVEYTFLDDALIYETKNTIYVCPLKYMVTWPYKCVETKYREKLTHRAEYSDDILDNIIAASAKLSIEMTRKEQEEPSEDYSDDELLNRIKKLQQTGQIEIEEMEQNERNRLIDIASNYEDCIYIEVYNAGIGNLLAYHLGNSTGVVHPQLHSGMFQDSVLYMKYASEEDQCSFDFRYWPMGWRENIETYSWSDNIKLAVIKNETGDLLDFNHTTIPAGETMTFTPEGHRQGLLSPDCHNGKC